VASYLSTFAARYNGCPRCPCKNPRPHEMGLDRLRSLLETAWTPWTDQRSRTAEEVRPGKFGGER